MDSIQFFKLQAKNLYKDYKTQFTQTEDNEVVLFDYSPKFFDINNILVTYEYQELEAKNFTLMKAQHLFSWLLGFDKWSDLINSPQQHHELLILLFKNKINIDEWDSRNLSYEEQIALLEFYLDSDTPLTRIEFLIHDF